MLEIPFNILPKAAVPAVMAVAAAAYVVIGPEIASRIARVDYLPGCERQVASLIAAGAADRRKAAQSPDLDPGKEVAAAYLRQLQNSPLFGEMRKHPLGGLKPPIKASAGTLIGCVRQASQGRAACVQSDENGRAQEGAAAILYGRRSQMRVRIWCSAAARAALASVSAATAAWAALPFR